MMIHKVGLIIQCLRVQVYKKLNLSLIKINIGKSVTIIHNNMKDFIMETETADIVNIHILPMTSKYCV